MVTCPSLAGGGPLSASRCMGPTLSSTHRGAMLTTMLVSGEDLSPLPLAYASSHGEREVGKKRNEKRKGERGRENVNKAKREQRKRGVRGEGGEGTESVRY